MATDPVKVGQLIADKDRARRDAIHVAVAPARAAHELNPGERVGFVTKGDTEMVGHGILGTHGIVDPFLTKPVKAGEWFWLFLYPDTTTSLKHFWSHPLYPKENES
jgi:hypothetical protein